MVIILINGAFGVGKTTVARVLVHQTPRCALYNPERVGSVLRVPVGRVVRRDDYQDLPLWCPLVVTVARLRYHGRGWHLVVPMCIWRRDYFDCIVVGLRTITPNVVCVRLTASPPVLRSRILARPESEGGHAWSIRHMDVCSAAFSDAHFGIEVATDGKTPETVAMHLAACLPR